MSKEAPLFSPDKTQQVNLGQETIPQNGHHPPFPFDSMIKRIEEFKSEKGKDGVDHYTSLNRKELEEMLGTAKKPIGTTRLIKAMKVAGIRPFQYWLNPFEASATEEALKRMPEVAEKRGREKPFYPPPPEYVSLEEAKKHIGVKSTTTVVECAKRAGIVLLMEHRKAFVPKNGLDELKAAKKQNRLKSSEGVDNRIEKEDVALGLDVPVKKLNEIYRLLGLNEKRPLNPEEYQRVEDYVKNQQQQALPIK